MKIVSIEQHKYNVFVGVLVGIEIAILLSVFHIIETYNENKIKFAHSDQLLIESLYYDLAIFGILCLIWMIIYTIIYLKYVKR